ncbi:hypothetical protein SAMN05444372_11928 [Flavobacterium micromati]|jgi:hypothetical protein|uniref:Uncharacterized protein n=1 Tax=Flavobacterium micromati TaxID=229205 RepID=A0A1M5QTM0_9FLAO|nr:hypothetical protein [Flavobacterium micromati]SHH17271.1 hypothetical protein SAMN05444372_11928 [Flavobacterium micromati]
MKIKDATELKNKNLHLIGQKFRGGTIDEIIIRPKSDEELDVFMKSYIRSMNAEKSLLPFFKSDLHVFAVFEKDKIRTSSVILMTEIENLLNEKLDIKK